MTISFVGLKRGLLTGEAVDYCGELLCDDLDIEPQLRQAVSSRIALLGDDQVLHALPHRARSDHKGLFGHLLVVGGDYGMAGAVLMAAQTALRCGAGLVSVATRPEHVPALVARCPELMVHGVRSGQELESLLERATQVLIGPGLGQSAWSSQLWNRVQGLAMPTVVDADALNLIAQGAFFEQNHGPWVLTPHPGEAARLLGVTTKEVQADRFAAAERLQQRYKGVIVLKGAGTLVEDGRAAWLCRRGNPGMASGGMGDTLAGGIAALLAQGLAPVEAACAGVQAHAWAADREAAEYGERGMLASDLVARMRTLLNGRIC